MQYLPFKGHLGFNIFNRLLHFIWHLNNMIGQIDGYSLSHEHKPLEDFSDWNAKLTYNGEWNHDTKQRQEWGKRFILTGIIIAVFNNHIAIILQLHLFANILPFVNTKLNYRLLWPRRASSVNCQPSMCARCCGVLKAAVLWKDCGGRCPKTTAKILSSGTDGGLIGVTQLFADVLLHFVGSLFTCQL